MLKVNNPYFSLTLPDGWEQGADQEGVESLCFVHHELRQKIVMDGVGLLSCASKEELSAELGRIVRQKKIELMREKMATSVDHSERLTEDELAWEFLSSFDGGALFMQVRTHVQPREGAHIVSLFSFEDRSESASLRTVSSSAGKLLEALRFVSS